jgi:hypothetical protein
MENAIGRADLHWKLTYSPISVTMITQRRIASITSPNPGRRGEATYAGKLRRSLDEMIAESVVDHVLRAILS